MGEALVVKVEIVKVTVVRNSSRKSRGRCNGVVSSGVEVVFGS